MYPKRKALYLTLLLISSLGATSNSCISHNDLLRLDKTVGLFYKAIHRHDFKTMSSMMNFPITDNHNHVITKRVFLEELEYAPVKSVKKVFSAFFPSKIKSHSSKGYQYLDECNKYVVEQHSAESKEGMRFIFKKVGKDVKLKLISFLNK